MEVKPEIKYEIKSKKNKMKKTRKPLNLLSDEESEQTFDDLSNQRHEQLRSRFAETRLQTLQNCRSDDNESAEDVFIGTTTNPNCQPVYGNNEINEVLSLINDIKKNEPPIDNDNNHDNNEDFVELNDSILVVSDCDKSVSGNTRSRRGRKAKKKATPKKITKKKTTTRRKSGRKSQESDFDENKAFERLEVMEAANHIEIVDDINSSLNISQDIEDYMKEKDIEIKFKYKAVIKRISIKSIEKFSKIMPLIAQMFGENVSEMIFEFEEKIIDSDSTPQSINLNVADFIVCHKRVIHKSNSNEFNDPNVLSLKLKDKTMKSAETININKFDKIQLIIDWFSKLKAIPSNKFSLHFDGEKLDSNLTVAESDIEDDSQIDVTLL